MGVEVCFWLIRTLAGDVASLAAWPEVQHQLAKAGRAVATSSQAAAADALKAWAADLRSQLVIQVGWLFVGCWRHALLACGLVMR